MRHVCRTNILLWLILAFVPAAQAQVVVDIFDEGIGADRKWPAKLSEPTETYTEQALGFFRAPWRYGEGGVRVDRGIPFLLRASATMTLPAGKVRLLVRAHGPARLWVDDAIVVELQARKRRSDDRNPLRSDELVLGQTRFVHAADGEKLVEYESSGGAHRVVFETIVGEVASKKALRPELGESLVAIAPVGSDQFALLAPVRNVPLTDAGWARYVADRSAAYDQIELARRLEARKAVEPEINARHAAARQWVARQPAPAVPEAPDAGNNPIDRFIADRLQKAQLASSQEKGAIHFYEHVRPILAERCWTCHSNKPKGGLRLDSLEMARRGGESKKPAILPGSPLGSTIIQHIRSKDPSEIMPPKGEPLKPAEIDLLESWIAQGASWPDEEPAADVKLVAICDDLTFLRRAYLDVVGVPPMTSDARAFIADARPDKRIHAIDRLLADDRWADVWTASWQDWLGENPSLVNGTLNNTGPFRWWLYESFRDRKPMDVFAMELVSMAGSPYGGAPAGFAIAGQNDAPMVAKAGVLASTLLSVDMKCARCHDAPFHSSTQSDLFHLAAMLARAPIVVPKSSVVSLEKLSAGGRKPLIKVTLKAGDSLSPSWPLTSLAPMEAAPQSSDSRKQLGALITSPENERFAQAMVNRIWHHYFGRGLVEPLDDWEHARPTNPQLLTWLAREFVSHDYDLRHIARLILTSDAYQRASDSNAKSQRFYASMPKRRASAEQVVDTLFSTFGIPMETETLCIDLDAIRTPDNGVNLGRPSRAWQFVYLSNDRDRPSLSLPRAQAVSEVLSAFGWTGLRQEVISQRHMEPNALQSALLQNGTMSRWLTRLTEESKMTRLAIDAENTDALVREVFLRVLTREPTAEESLQFNALLEPGFYKRVLPVGPATKEHRFVPYVAWSNHLDPDANLQRQREAVEARAGNAPTRRLDPEWRERMEDFLWSLLNAPELVYVR